MAEVAEAPAKGAPAKESKSPFSDWAKSGMADEVKAPEVNPALPVEEVGRVQLEKPPLKIEKEEEPPPEVKSEAGKSSWKKLKEEREALQRERDEWKSKLENESKTYTQRLQELETQLNETKAKFDPQAFEQLKQEREELWRAQRLSDVKQLPEFKRNFTEPLNRLTDVAMQSVPEQHKPLLKYLLGMPESQDRNARLDEIVASLSPYAAARVANVTTQIDDIRNRMETVLSQEKEVVERYQQEQKVAKERQEAQEKLQRQNILKEVADEIRGYKLPGFVEIEGDDKHNASVAAAYEKARQLATITDPKGIAKIAHLAVFGESVVPIITKQNEEIEQLKATIAKLQSVTPGRSAPKEAKGDSIGDEKRPFSKGLGLIN